MALSLLQLHVMHQRFVLSSYVFFHNVTFFWRGDILAFCCTWNANTFKAFLWNKVSTRMDIYRINIPICITSRALVLDNSDIQLVVRLLLPIQFITWTLFEVIQQVRYTFVAKYLSIPLLCCGLVFCRSWMYLLLNLRKLLYFLIIWEWKVFH